MTVGFFQLFKIGFKIRILIYTLVILSATMANVFTAPLFKLFWILLLVVSAEAATFIFTRAAFENIVMAILHRGTVQPMPIEVQDLAQRMVVRIKTFKVAPNFHNAYTNGNNVVIGQTLMDELTKDELLAVIAHELAHIKENHLLIRLGVLIPIFFIATINFYGLPEILGGIAVLSYVMLVLTPLNWYLEVRADRLARQFVGAEAMKSALTILIGGKDMKEASETHPPIAKRIESLDKL